MNEISIENYPVYGILDKAKRIALSYNTSKDISKFQEQEQDALSTFFKYFLKDDYLFSAITHLKKNKIDLDADSKKASEIYSFGKLVQSSEFVTKALNSILDDILNDIREEKALSMTQAVLKDIETAIFFHCSSVMNQIKPEFNNTKNAIDLDLFDWEDKFESFVTKNSGKFEETIFHEKAPFPQRIAQIVYHYKRIAKLFDDNSREKLFVYFIRSPLQDYVSQNGLLSIATTRELSPKEYGIIYLSFYRFQAELYLEAEKEKNKFNEQIETLKNISASTHAIKTFIGVKFNPLINSLSRKYSKEPLLPILNQSKNELLNFAELVNLMSKLTIPNQPISEIKKFLENSGLFNTEKTDMNLVVIFDKCLKIRNLDAEFSMMNEITLLKKINDIEDDDIDKYTCSGLFHFMDLHPTILFFELLMSTILENIIQHGSSKYYKELTINLNKAANSIEFRNPIREDRKSVEDIRILEYTGNFRIFNVLMKTLNLGEFDAYQPANKPYFLCELKITKLYGE